MKRDLPFMVEVIIFLLVIGAVCIGIDTALLMIETCDFSALKEACAAPQEQT